MLRQLKDVMEQLLVRRAGWRRHKAVRRQKIDVLLLQEFLRICGDPDFKVMSLFDRGVPLGWREKMPRTPSVYERKESWKLDKDVDVEEEARWPPNYETSMDRQEDLRKQLDEEAKADPPMVMAITYGEAKKRWPGRLQIAALGASEQPGAPGTDPDFRFTHDGTHGVLVNHHVRPRDRIRSPLGSDLKRLIADMAITRMGGSAFCLVFDISKAHRRVMMREQDWGLMGCTPESQPPSADEDVLYVNCVGTYGMASAAYWWSRLGGAGARAVFYALGHRHSLYQTIYVDDILLGCGGHNWHESLILGLIVWLVFNFPIKWSKLGGGLQFDWIGYYCDVPRFRLGISVKRCRWLMEWCSSTVQKGILSRSELQEVLGRLSFASRVIEDVRPFLGPLYAWASSMSHMGVRSVPAMIKLILEYIAESLGEQSTVACVVKAVNEGELFRTDAKAEGRLVVLGGWDSSGKADPKHAKWFSLTLDEKTSAWAYEKGGEPSRVIAALELYATAIGVKLFAKKPAAKPDLYEASVVVSGGTDNLGNGYLVDKFMTSKYPSCAMLMELCRQCKMAGVSLGLCWRRRDTNVEADALTNYEFEAFSEENRIPLTVKDLDFTLLDRMLARGKELYEEIQVLKEARKMSRHTALGGGKKRRRLRLRAPWNHEFPEEMR
jgi:hypothetical protein